MLTPITLILQDVSTAILPRTQEICTTYNFIDREGHSFQRVEYSPLTAETIKKATTVFSPGQFSQLKNTGLLDRDFFDKCQTIVNSSTDEKE